MTLAIVNVANASNASPIVVTTSSPHGLTQPVGGAPVVTIAGVLGNTAANGTWTVSVVDASNVQLLGSAGNGAYASGGTLLGPLPPANALVGLFSQELVARLAARGLPPLVDGRILLGGEHVLEQSSPTRVVFVPKGSDFKQAGPPEMGGTANKATIRTSVERRAQLAQRPIATDVTNYEVHVWGKAPTVTNLTDQWMQKELDVGVTQQILDALLVSMYRTAVGTFKVSSGTWTQGKATSAQVSIDGLEYVFNVAVRRPVIDDAYGFAPAGVKPSFTNSMQDPAGVQTVGCTT